MFSQAHQKALCLAEIFQYVHIKFLGTLDNLKNHPGAQEDNETTTPPTSTSQDCSIRSVLSG